MEPETQNAPEVEESSEEGVTPEAPKTMRDFVASKKAERAATESTPKKVEQSAKAEGKTDPEPAVDPAADDSKKPYSDDEMASMDLRNADIDRVPKYARETVRKMQAAEARKHSDLNAKGKELDELIAKAKGIGKKDEKAESSDDEMLPVTRDELRSILQSKAGKEFLAETLQELGVDLDDSRERADQRFMQSAVADAATEEPDLANPEFFEKVVEKIRNTPKWAEIVRESKDKKQISLAFQAAVGRVKSDIADQERKTIASEKEKAAKEREALKRQKEAANKKPASHAAGTQRKSTIAMGEKPSIAEFIRQRRESRNPAT